MKRIFGIAYVWAVLIPINNFSTISDDLPGSRKYRMPTLADERNRREPTSSRLAIDVTRTQIYSI